ncbi:MAG: hypothetical protein R3F11_27920 [Verrucomicrobiales bacterium]
MLFALGAFRTYQRYQAIQKLAPVSEFYPFSGPLVWVETKIRGEVPDGEIPVSAYLPFVTMEAIKLQYNVGEAFHSTEDLGAAVRIIGPKEVFAFFPDDYAGFFRGLAESHELTFFYCGLCDQFTGEDLEALSHFRSLKCIELWWAEITDVGHLEFPSLESFYLGGGEVDVSLIESLKKARTFTP